MSQAAVDKGPAGLSKGLTSCLPHLCFLKLVQKSVPGAGQSRKRRLKSQPSFEPRQDLEPISFLPFGSSYLRYGQASEALSKSLCGSGHCIRELDKSATDILQP